MLLVLAVPIGSAQCQTRSELGVDAGIMAWTMAIADQDAYADELTRRSGPAFTAALCYRETPVVKAGLHFGVVYTHREFDMQIGEGGLGSGTNTYEFVRTNAIHAMLGLNIRLSEQSRFHLRPSLLIGCWAQSLESGYTTRWSYHSAADTTYADQFWTFENRERDGPGGGVRFQLGLSYSILVGSADLVSCEPYVAMGITGDHSFVAGVRYLDAGIRIGYSFGLKGGMVGEFFRKDRERRFGKKPPDP